MNRISNGAFLEFLGVRPGTDVLEVGSGLGILAAAVAGTASAVRVVGVERAAAQLASTTPHPRVRYVQGDAHHLPFSAAAFDLAYARYVLEHVRHPEQVLAEIRRVVRPGGRVAACENDISLLRIDPPCPAFEQVWTAFQEHQRRLGGDSGIGRRLFRLFRHAGFTRIELSVQPEVHWYGSPMFDGWIRNIAGNVESARQGLLDSRLCSPAQLEAALDELAAAALDPDASSCFVWNRAMATR